MEAPSSFLKAFTLQPGSTTMTLIGRQLSSTPRAMAASMMRSACAIVIVVMGGNSLGPLRRGVVPSPAPARHSPDVANLQRRHVRGRESGLDRLDSVSVRVGELVKDGAKRRRLRRSAILDKFANTNNLPSKRSRPPSDHLRG